MNNIQVLLLKVKHKLFPLMFVDIYIDIRITENQSLFHVLKNLKIKVIFR